VSLFPSRGQPAFAPWRLALVTVMQFAEGLSDRDASDAVRTRIDWKYLLGLELTDSGFDYSILSRFRDRLIDGQAEMSRGRWSIALASRGEPSSLSHPY
jgi:transposase